MFYVIERENQSPDHMRNGDVSEDYCLICKTPGETNMSHEERTEGWLGTSNDWCETAHGEFETLEEAQEKCAALGYEIPNPEDEYNYDDDQVESYLYGAAGNDPDLRVTDLESYMFGQSSLDGDWGVTERTLRSEITDIAAEDSPTDRNDQDGNGCWGFNADDVEEVLVAAYKNEYGHEPFDSDEAANDFFEQQEKSCRLFDW